MVSTHEKDSGKKYKRIIIEEIPGKTQYIFKLHHSYFNIKLKNKFSIIHVECPLPEFIVKMKC